MEICLKRGLYKGKGYKRNRVNAPHLYYTDTPLVRFSATLVDLQYGGIEGGCLRVFEKLCDAVDSPGAGSWGVEEVRPVDIVEAEVMLWCLALKLAGLPLPRGMSVSRDRVTKIEVIEITMPSAEEL